MKCHDNCRVYKLGIHTLKRNFKGLKSSMPRKLTDSSTLSHPLDKDRASQISSNPLYHYRSLAVQFIRIPLVALLLAIFQPSAFMVLQHAMFAAVVSVAKTAVAYDALRRLFAFFVTASDFPRGHATAQGQGDVDRGQRRDVERCESGG